MEEFTLDNLNDNKVEEKTEEQPKHRKVVLANLAPIKSEDMVEIDPKKYVASSKKEEPETYADTLFSDLDSALDRTKSEIKERQEVFKENIEEILENKGVAVNGDDSFIKDAAIEAKEENVEEPKKEEVKPEEKEVSNIDNINDMDEDIEKEESLIFDDDDEEISEADIDNEVTSEEKKEEEKRILGNKIKENVVNTIGIFHNKFDLSKFKIKQNAISVSKLLKQNGAEIKTADWVLYNSGKPLTCSALSALEINALNPDSSQRNKLNTLLDIFKIIYNHVIDANKPEFETWLKKTNFFDVNHIYFALYKATFSKSNYINYLCPNDKCKETSLVDIKFDDMIVYKNDEVKEKVKNILRKDTTSESKEQYDADLIQISDQYAVALKSPSIWNAYIELASFDEEFTRKYSSEIDLYAFIDNVFYIDSNTQELIPIDMGVVEKNQAKTSLNRVKTLHKVIGTLNTDQYQQLIGYAREYNLESDDITYRIPEYVCPKCKTKIEAVTTEARDLLFYRHQLGTFRTI